MVDLQLAPANRVLSSARQALDQHAADTVAGLQSTLDRAQSDLENHVTYVVVNGQAVLNDARKSLDHRANAIIGNAMQVASVFGVTVPEPTTLATSRSFPPPEIVAITPAVGESLPAIAPTGTGGTFPSAGCLVHLLPTSIRQTFTDLYVLPIGAYVVYAFNYVPPPNTEKLIRRYPNWWQAELACRLLMECHWQLSEVLAYSDAIDRVKLFNGETGFEMHTLCDNAKSVFDGFTKAIGG